MTQQAMMNPGVPMPNAGPPTPNSGPSPIHRGSMSEKSKNEIVPKGNDIQAAISPNEKQPVQ